MCRSSSCFVVTASHTPRTDRSWSRSSSSSPAAVISCAWSVQYRSYATQHALDRAGHSSPTRQHELDHTDHTDDTDHTISGLELRCLADLDHELNCGGNRSYRSYRSSGRGAENFKHLRMKRVSAQRHKYYYAVPRVYVYFLDVFVRRLRSVNLSSATTVQ